MPISRSYWGYRIDRKESESNSDMHHQMLSMDSSYLKTKRPWVTGNGVCARLKSNAFYVFFFLFGVFLWSKKSFSITMLDFIATSNSIRHRTRFFHVLWLQIEWNGPVSEWVSTWVSERRTTENVFKRFNCARSPFYLTLIIHISL